MSFSLSNRVTFPSSAMNVIKIKFRCKTHIKFMYIIRGTNIVLLICEVKLNVAVQIYAQMLLQPGKWVGFVRTTCS